MQLPAQFQKFLVQAADLDPQLARHLEHLKVVDLLRKLEKFAARGAKVSAKRAFVAIPAHQRRIRCCRWCRHNRFKPSKVFWQVTLRPARRRTPSLKQKRWLASSAANHLQAASASAKGPHAMPSLLTP